MIRYRVFKSKDWELVKNIDFSSFTKNNVNNSSSPHSQTIIVLFCTETLTLYQEYLVTARSINFQNCCDIAELWYTWLSVSTAIDRRLNKWLGLLRWYSLFSFNGFCPYYTVHRTFANVNDHTLIKMLRFNRTVIWIDSVQVTPKTRYWTYNEAAKKQRLNFVVAPTENISTVNFFAIAGRCSLRVYYPHVATNSLKWEPKVHSEV